MFSKINVNGPDTHPLYAYMKSQLAMQANKDKISDIKWNFSKFFVKDGQVDF